MGKKLVDIVLLLKIIFALENTRNNIVFEVRESLRKSAIAQLGPSAYDNFGSNAEFWHVRMFLKNIFWLFGLFKCF